MSRLLVCLLVAGLFYCLPMGENDKKGEFHPDGGYVCKPVDFELRYFEHQGINTKVSVPYRCIPYGKLGDIVCLTFPKGAILLEEQKDCPPCPQYKQWNTTPGITLTPNVQLDRVPDGIF